LSFADERQAIENRFSTLWTESAKIMYENQQREEPKDDASWVALFIVDTPGNQIDLRDVALHRQGGIIIVQVFVREGVGTQSARVLVDAVATIFRRATFSVGASGTIKCRTTSIESLGVSDGWFQMNASTPFIRDTLHARAV